MFCPECGTKISDEASFCPKCGTKVGCMDTATQAPGMGAVAGKDSTAIQGQEAIVDSSGTAVAEKSTVDCEADLKAFVDSHIQAATSFHSAEELLHRHVPQTFLWLCLGIPFVIGLIRVGLLGGLVLTIFLGYPVALLIDLFKGFHVRAADKKVNTVIDPNKLLQFLDSHLGYLAPYFHEWGYMNYNSSGILVKMPPEDVSLGKAAVKSVLIGSGIFLKQAAVAKMRSHDNASQIKIGTEFGNKKRCYVVIWIWPDTENSDSGQMTYCFKTGLRSLLWASRYDCMVKAGPILQAVMEYYIENYEKGGI